MRASKPSLSPLVLTSSIFSSISLGATGPVVESALIRMVRLVRPSFRRNAPEGVGTLSVKAVNVQDKLGRSDENSINLFGTSIPFGWLHEGVDPQWVGGSPDEALNALKDSVQKYLGSIQKRASQPATRSRAEADAKDLTAMLLALEDFSGKHHGFACPSKLKDGVAASLHAVKAAIGQHAKSMVD